MKIRGLKLLFFFFGSILFMVLIRALSIGADNIKNDFIRKLPSHLIFGIVAKDIGYNSWYFSGDNFKSIVLGNIVAPRKVLLVDTNFTHTNTINLTGFEGTEIYKGSSLIVDSGSIYLMDGLKPTIFKGLLSNMHLNQQIQTPYFTSSVPTNDGLFVLRYINSRQENVLAKTKDRLGRLQPTNLLEKQVDGVFCTDGVMIKVPGSQKMIYVYYYRNQFLCTDSNLNLLYKGKTIDTVSQAQIKVEKITSTGETTMSAPPFYVNKLASANSRHLFVQSALRANNETGYMTKDVSMIDVYAIADGKYQFSFYLPDFRGFKVRDFKVYGQSLYALYDHYLYKYQLNF